MTTVAWVLAGLLAWILAGFLLIGVWALLVSAYRRRHDRRLDRELAQLVRERKP